MGSNWVRYERQGSAIKKIDFLNIKKYILKNNTLAYCFFCNKYTKAIK